MQHKNPLDKPSTDKAIESKFLDTVNKNIDALGRVIYGKKYCNICFNTTYRTISSYRCCSKTIVFFKRHPHTAFRPFGVTRTDRTQRFPLSLISDEVEGRPKDHTFYLMNIRDTDASRPVRQARDELVGSSGRWKAETTIVLSKYYFP